VVPARVVPAAVAPVVTVAARAVGLLDLARAAPVPVLAVAGAA
jgi:hypothetical protein